MSFNFESLDDSTRAKMLVELDTDLAKNCMYQSAIMREDSRDAYLGDLRRSFLAGDISTLEAALLSADPFRGRNASGAVVNKAAAASTLSGTQFNHYYVRAMCVRALEEGRKLEYYRAKDSAIRRPKTEEKLGKQVDVEDTLQALRENSAKPENLKVFLVSSGLSVRFAE